MRLARLALLHVLTCACVALSACSAELVSLDRDAGTGSGDDDGADDGTGVDSDAGGSGGPCAPKKTQCNNCEDDDGDGFTDGNDPHCSGPLDDDELSFSSGIPGDNQDRRKQDCFFDGNSGGCQVHTCCLLETCDEDLYGMFDPKSDCERAAECAEECEPITPPACDCFGCCTVCTAGTSDCHDVLITPAVSPDCSMDDLASDACVKCVKSEECNGGGCGAAECILCPGQSEDDLPAECGGNQCPGGGTTCDTSADCDPGDYCSSGCCIGAVD